MPISALVTVMNSFAVPLGSIWAFHLALVRCTTSLELLFLPC